MADRILLARGQYYELRYRQAELEKALAAATLVQARAELAVERARQAAREAERIYRDTLARVAKDKGFNPSTEYVWDDADCALVPPAPPASSTATE